MIIWHRHTERHQTRWKHYRCHSPHSLGKDNNEQLTSINRWCWFAGFFDSILDIVRQHRLHIKSTRHNDTISKTTPVWLRSNLHQQKY